MAEQDSSVPAADAVLWTGGPAYWTGGWTYVLAILLTVGGAVGAYWWIGALTAVALGLLLGFFKYLNISARRYRLTADRLITSYGVLTRRTDELELYRVKDAVLLEPLWMRLLGRGKIVIYTSDLTTPTLVLYAIADASRVRELIRTQVEATRTRKGVRELDVE